MSKRTILIRVLAFVMIASIHLPNGTIIKASKTNYITSKEEFAQAIYDNLLAKNKTFRISYNGDWEDVYQNDLDGLFNEVCDIDDKDTSDDYDYMKGNIKTYSLSLSSDGITSTFDFAVTYRETAKQTKQVNALVAKTIKSLKINKASDYTKVKKIHDYIVNRISYDQSYSKYTAYQAIVKKSAVCQGYTLLFYKMATEAGLSCRMVTSSNHAWNIVKMGEKWYHVDVTWDDPIASKPVLRYDFFLKGTKSMTDSHTLSAEYRTKAFKAAFPISTTDYKK